MVPEVAERIRRLNDEFRQGFTGGRILTTSGIRAFPDADLAAIMREVQAFSEFSAENDPHGEHNFGSFRYGDQLIYWKIDYYDQAMEWGSPDPANPAVTTRVLTVLLAEEW